MRVLLVRHGLAVPGTGRMPDEARYLAEDGRRITRSVANALREQGYAPTRILTSPLVRAVQTAEIFAHVFDVSNVAALMSLSTEDGSARDVRAVVDAGKADETLVLVTHEPKVRAIAALLGNVGSFPGFPTAGVALFEGPPGALAVMGRLDPHTLQLETVISGY